MLPDALAQARRIIEAGETALPTITGQGAHSTFTMILALDPAQMQRGFETAHQIMIHRQVRRFIISGETTQPDALYAALVSAEQAQGLIQRIRRTPRLAFSEPQTLPQSNLTDMMGLAYTGGQTLQPEAERKIRSILSLHAQLGSKTPIIIRD